MRWAAWLTVSLVMAACLNPGAVSAQSATGLEKTGKAGLPPSAARALEGDTSLGNQDAAVAHLVHAPVKALGLRGFTPEARVALKALMEEAEARIRVLMTLGGRGARWDTEASVEIERVVRDYVMELETLAAER